MATNRMIRIGEAEIELQLQGNRLLGLGRVRIGGRLVRSGELPIRPFTQTLDGIEYDRYEILDIRATARRAVIRTRAIGTADAARLTLDHSLDPIWSTRPWDGRTVAEDRMDWILEAGARRFGEWEYEGFSYEFRFHSSSRSIFYILDRATWELDGRAEGITLLRQQMGCNPRVTLAKDTNYSCSAIIPFPLHPVMTHDVPRWASEQAFDYQCRGDAALIGVFDRCGLIRSIVAREPKEAAIRHFDKHVFDQSADAATTRKFIGLCPAVGDDTDHLNAWTRVFDHSMDAALGEFGMRRTPTRSTLCQNCWFNFTADTYRKDLLPAAVSLGFQQLFIDTFWENDMTRKTDGTLPKYQGGTMCSPHEYEVSKVVGGIPGYRRLARDARKLGVEIISWVGSHQSVESPYLIQHPAQILKLPDARHHYGSGYDGIRGMDLTSDFGSYFRDSMIRACKATGVAGYLYDSFYNFGWMAVNYHTPDPKHPNDPNQGTIAVRTQWRQLGKIMAALQKAGVHMLIESLGPWGQPQHGTMGDYTKPEHAPLAYRCSIGSGYSTIPVAATANAKKEIRDTAAYFRLLAHMAPPTMPLWIETPGQKPVRIDHAMAGSGMAAAHSAYRKVLPLMHTRTILPGDLGVAWAPAKGAGRVLFALRDGTLPVSAKKRSRDLMTGAKVACARGGLPVQAGHVYLLGR